MSRLKADLLLLLVALIWGLAFVAQKDAMQHVGALTFVAARFALSALVVLPLAIREHRQAKTPAATFDASHVPDLILLCTTFAGGMILQQAGIARTSITNAGFLTGLYVLFVPLVCFVIYRQKLSRFVFPSAILSVAGVWLLSGGMETLRLNVGDILVIGCAICFGFQVPIVGRIVRKVKAPLRICLIQYIGVFLIALSGALAYEAPSAQDIITALPAILYAGVLSGGIAFTLQVIAQQSTPASDSAVILSAESLFAAIGGALLVQEHLTPAGLAGCGLIVCAILLVEFGPMAFRKAAAA